MIDKPSLEVPPELRKLNEKNIEKAHASFTQFLEFFTEVMRAWPGSSSTPFAPGFKTVQDRAIEFAKENAEGSFKLASDLASAADIRQMLEIQNRYAQRQLQTNSRQAQELVQLMSKALSEPELKKPKSKKPKSDK